jgi:hypothetical protein
MFFAVPSKYQVILLIAIGTGILCWPAFFNGMPLLYPDSMAYIGDGNYVARALFFTRTMVLLRSSLIYLWAGNFTVSFAGQSMAHCCFAGGSYRICFMAGNTILSLSAPVR